MQEALPWIIALAILVVIAAGMAFWVTRPRPLDSVPLPTEWSVGPRTVFTVDERRAHRQLRDAFPQHIVLAKLPLIRFCQPSDAHDMRYWFELLGSIHVTFAVCTPQGRVLATVDLDGQRPISRRAQQIKQHVLAACRIRYLRCTIDHLPSVDELQALLPPHPGAEAAPLVARAGASEVSATGGALEPLPREAGTAAPSGSAALPQIRPVPSAAAASQVGRGVRPAEAAPRRQRKPLWQDSGLFQDSFFGIDNLRDAGPRSDVGNLLDSAGRSRPAPAGPDISADPTQGMLESELLKHKQDKRR